MAGTLQFDLVSPERRLASVKAQEVQLPGANGDMTAMADHAPVITTLRPGLLRVVHDKGTDEYLVFGGFAEIGPGAVSVLAERALPRAEVNQQTLDAMLAEAKAAPGLPDDVAKTVADLAALADQIELSARG
jgi:F-type H+-transporting ATPase subunit epsilon